MPAGAALAAYKLASRLARLLPAWAAAMAGQLIGLGLARTDAERRRIVGRNLRRIHGGDLPPRVLRRQVRRAFGSYARYWVELFRLPGVTPAGLDAGLSVEGMEHLDRALDAGAGAIVALPHLGGWDWAGAWIATRGRPITVVVEPLEPPEMLEWFASYRRTLGMTVVPLGPTAGTAVLDALRNNHIVCLLCDRDIGGGGVEVELFGERTTLPAGPVTLALRTGAPIVPVAVYFRGRGHRGVVRPPLDLARQGSFRDDVARLTQDLARELELLITAAPEQWHVFQPNWPSDRE